MIGSDGKCADSAAVADLDGDGDLDVPATFSAKNRLVWYESDLADQGGQPHQGDAERDGEVTFADLLRLPLQ